MAFLECSINSSSLRMATSFCASLPNDVVKRPEGGFPVVYLLHGLSDDHTMWARRTCIDRYAAERGIAVIMPEVQRSFYTDMKFGMKYFTYVSQELPKLCREMFGLSASREKTFVAGLSMGGFGALRCGLIRPDVFSACAGLSSVIDIGESIIRNSNFGFELEAKAILGEDLAVPEQYDLFSLASKAAALPETERPRVMTCCGTEDFLYQNNRRFKAFMEKSGLTYRYAEGPGNHEWRFWDQYITSVLDFFIASGN